MLLPFSLGFRGAARPERDPRIETIATSSWQFPLMQQTLVGYAGDDENPRELPTRTLFSMREKMQDTLDAERDRAAQLAPHSIYLAFCHDRVRMPAEQVIAVPREDLWWLAAPGDLLLLSDKVTHHFATMLCVPPGSERLYLVDEWPDRSFLRAGFNEEDVRASVEPFFAGVFDSILPGRQQVGVSREEYLRVIVGLVTLDTPALLDRYLAYRPAVRDDAAVMYAFGRNLMTPARDEIARFAAPYFARAEGLAVVAGDGPLAREAAAWSYAAHVIAVMKQVTAGDHLAVKPFAEEMHGLDARHGEKELLAVLDVETLARLGHAAGRAEQYNAAFRYLDLAIERDPFHDAVHWLRAKVHQYRGEPEAQVADATEALARNAAWIARREAERAARDPRDRYGRMDDDGRIAGLQSRRWEELLIRSQGLVALGRLDEARTDAEAAVTLRPERAAPYRLLAGIAQRTGNLGATRAHLEAALEREKSPSDRSTLRWLLANMPTALDASQSDPAPGREPTSG
jgi:tetratricopeptide (TPR) repeat protein